MRYGTAFNLAAMAALVLHDSKPARPSVERQQKRKPIVLAAIPEFVFEGPGSESHIVLGGSETMCGISIPSVGWYYNRDQQQNVCLQCIKEYAAEFPEVWTVYSGGTYAP